MSDWRAPEAGQRLKITQWPRLLQHDLISVIPPSPWAVSAVLSVLVGTCCAGVVRWWSSSSSAPTVVGRPHVTGDLPQAVSPPRFLSPSNFHTTLSLLSVSRDEGVFLFCLLYFRSSSSPLLSP